MNISSPSSQNSIFGLNNQTNTSRKPLVRSVEPDISKAEQEKPLNKQANKGVVADQQAIALFEQNQFELDTAKTSYNNDSSNTSASSKDKPSPKNEIAVASYQSVDNLAQRESVQQLFGVDVFA